MEGRNRPERPERPRRTERPGAAGRRPNRPNPPDRPAGAPARQRSSAEGLYAQPRDVSDPEQCTFYHAMELPGVGRVGGHWDLRATVDDYLGHFDFAGKRVLDVGAASGFLTFEMERRGATVVSFDLGEDQTWDVVPFAELNLDNVYRARKAGRERILNAYWLAHRTLGSKARAYYGNIYDFPRELGAFDVAFFGTVLPHLRDPFEALRAATALVTDSVVITDAHHEADAPVMTLMAKPGNPRGHLSWWRISEPLMSNMLQILGFEAPTITRSSHLYASEEREVVQTTYVAHRTPYFRKRIAESLAQ